MGRACWHSGTVSAVPEVGDDIRMDAALRLFFYSSAVSVFTS